MDFPENWRDQKLALERGELTAVELTTVLLDRIRAGNPALRAITDLIPKTAMQEAQAVDKGLAVSQISGMSMIIKDLIDVTPAECSAGFDFLKNHRPTRDARCVAKLRADGAVILGVSATDAGGFGVRTLQTHHPQAAEHIVGGSSGGTAAAVAAGFAPAGLGTDTGGSLRIPAACCQLAAFKPSRDRIDLEGVRPFARTLDHVGAIGRGTRELMTVFQSLDPESWSHSQSLNSISKVGFDPAYFADASSDIHRGFQIALEKLRSMGAEIHRIHLPHPDEVLPVHDHILAFEAADYYLRQLGRQPEDFPEIGRTTLEQGSSLSKADYEKAMAMRRSLTSQVNEVFEVVDAVLLPTLPILSPRREVAVVFFGEGQKPVDISLRRYTCLFNQTGHPVVNLPFHEYRRGVGVSVQLVGSLNHDAELLDFAMNVEDSISV